MAHVPTRVGAPGSSIYIEYRPDIEDTLMSTGIQLNFEAQDNGYRT